MKKNQNKCVQLLNYFLTFRSIIIELIVLSILQIIYSTISYILKFSFPYFINIFVIVFIFILLSLLLVSFIIYKLYIYYSTHSRKLAKNIRKSILLILFNILYVNGIIFILLLHFLYFSNNSILQIILIDAVVLFVLLSLFINEIFCYKEFVALFYKKSKYVNRSAKPGHLYEFFKYIKRYKILSVIILLFIFYSIILMYKCGFKGQVTFFSNFISIIATVIISLSFMSIKLRESRKNDFINSLYKLDYKSVVSTIKFIHSFQPLIDKVRINSSDEDTYDKRTKNSIVEIGKEFSTCIGKFNDLEDIYLDPLLLTHTKSLGLLFDIFQQKLIDMVKYYDKVFRDKQSFKSIQNTYSKINNVNTVVTKKILLKLIKINDSYRKKLNYKN